MSFHKVGVAVTAHLTGTSEGVDQTGSHWPLVGGKEAGLKVARAIAIMPTAVLSSPAAVQLSKLHGSRTSTLAVLLALPGGPAPERGGDTHLTGNQGGLRNMLFEKRFQVEPG